MIFKNKHIIAALIIAPILAIISYFATDYFVSEKPHKLIEGNVYKLLAKPNCRYKSGICELMNASINISLTAEDIGNSMLKLNLNSNTKIEGIRISLIDSVVNKDVSKLMITDTNDGLNWYVLFNNPNSDNSILRLALNINDAIFYAEVNTIFLTSDAIYKKSK